MVDCTVVVDGAVVVGAALGAEPEPPQAVSTALLAASKPRNQLFRCISPGYAVQTTPFGVQGTETTKRPRVLLARETSQNPLGRWVGDKCSGTRHPPLNVSQWICRLRFRTRLRIRATTVRTHLHHARATLGAYLRETNADLSTSAAISSSRTKPDRPA